jgi:hypothetical protein
VKVCAGNFSIFKQTFNFCYCRCKIGSEVGDLITPWEVGILKKVNNKSLISTKSCEINVSKVETGRALTKSCEL